MIAGETFNRWAQLPAPLGTVALAHAEALRVDTGVSVDEALRTVLDDLAVAVDQAHDHGSPTTVCATCPPDKLVKATNSHGAGA